MGQELGYGCGDVPPFAVNTLVVLEVFYLFSVRYLDAPSLTLRGILGTPAVLIAVGIVAGLQLMFTYAPFMQQFFTTCSLDLAQGATILAIGIAGLAIPEPVLMVEIEKMICRHLKATSRKDPTSSLDEVLRKALPKLALKRY